MQSSRAHTGRRRNEATRHAVLAAAVRLLTSSDLEPLTLPAIAAEAGVGKQTVYRWWSSPGEVLLEAMSERATDEVPVPDTGSLRTDVREFLTASFRVLQDPAAASALRGLAREAARDEQAATLLREFAARRRTLLRGILARHSARHPGRLAAGVDLDLLVDQVYGTLWYRLLVGHAPLDDAAAGGLADALVAAATVSGGGPGR